MSPPNGMPRIYPWQWMKMWYQFSMPARYQRLNNLSEGADSSWNNREFLKEHPLDMDRLRCPESNESLLVVYPGDIQRREMRDEVQATLKCRDRIVLFKSFFSAEEELLAWGREPTKHFKNEPYLFDVPLAERAPGEESQLQWMELFSAIEKMAAGASMYLGFSFTLAQNNLEFRAHLERVLQQVADLLPVEDNIKRCHTHSFLYHGNNYQALLHQAMTPDFSFQIANSKYWRFVMHKWSPLMEAYPFPAIPGVWFSRHGLIHHTDIPFVEVLAEPGDILFFPEHLWHEVHNVEEGPGLMCGLRSSYTPRRLLKQVFNRDGISRSLAWHKFSSLASV